MSCYACTKGFGMLTREHGCANCGFGFCSNCVRFRAIVPGNGKNEMKVCAKCHKNLQNPDKVEPVYALPEALQKRLDALENPNKTPIIVYKDNKKMASLKQGLSSEDQKNCWSIRKIAKGTKTEGCDSVRLRNICKIIKTERRGKLSQYESAGTCRYRVLRSSW